MNSPTIIKNQNAFTDYFFKVKGKKITIVSAFASETTEVVERMLASGNTVDVIVGTINSFTSPKFIEECKEIAKDNKNIKFSVDFRYESSVHWKLYLISPSTVIIGSANFTQTGLTFERDTCVAIQDKKLYDDYLGMVAELKGLMRSSNPPVKSSMHVLKSTVPITRKCRQQLAGDENSKTSKVG